MLLAVRRDGREPAAAHFGLEDESAGRKKARGRCRFSNRGALGEVGAIKSRAPAGKLCTGRELERVGKVRKKGSKLE